jgi:hypothetical protein
MDMSSCAKLQGSTFESVAGRVFFAGGPRPRMAGNQFNNRVPGQLLTAGPILSHITRISRYIRLDYQILQAECQEDAHDKPRPLLHKGKLVSAPATLSLSLVFLGGSISWCMYPEDVPSCGFEHGRFGRVALRSHGPGIFVCQPWVRYGLHTDIHPEQ